MKAIFLGVGEAFDENYPNNSTLIISDKTNLMIDCGDAAVRQLWIYIRDNKLDHNLIDAVYITHRHSDHLFGLPALLSRMLEEKRTKPFTIICSSPLRDDIVKICNHAYLGTASTFGFELNFLEIKRDETINFNELKLSFVKTHHSVPNLAIKIETNNESICYSGDGPFNEKSENLYKNSELVIHEAYLYDKRIIGHECIKELIEMAKRNNIKCLALVHLNKHFRKNDINLIKDTIESENKKGKIKILLPEPLDEYELK
jgi:ribonuclease Z